MTNHVHLVIDPGPQACGLALLMKRVAGRQTRYANRLEARIGTLWAGRFKSSPIQTDEYLLACCRYVELNPVRAGLVSDPSEYPWSSYPAKINRTAVRVGDFDPCYMDLGNTAEERAARYAVWVKAAIPVDEWARIRQAVQAGHPIGNSRFMEDVAVKIGRRVECRRQGRPAKVK